MITEILKRESTKRAGVIISKFIKVALNCLTMRNYNSVMQIYMALQNRCVTENRLIASWEGVSENLKSKLEDLFTKVVNPSGNQGEYRRRLRDPTSPNPKVKKLIY